MHTTPSRCELPNPAINRGKNEENEGKNNRHFNLLPKTETYTILTNFMDKLETIMNKNILNPQKCPWTWRDNQNQI